jgi:hypothetical protein
MGVPLEAMTAPALSKESWLAGSFGESSTEEKVDDELKESTEALEIIWRGRTIE